MSAILSFFSSEVLAGFVLALSGILLGCIAMLARLLFRVRTLEERQKLFLKGKKGADLEAVIMRHDQEIDCIDKEIEEISRLSEDIRRLALSGIHRIGVVRFNPFQDTGGNQSFSIALLDGSNSGFVISSLLSREGGRVYAKPVVSGEAKDYPFTAEEKRAIELAKKRTVIEIENTKTQST